MECPPKDHLRIVVAIDNRGKVIFTSLGFQRNHKITVPSPLYLLMFCFFKRSSYSCKNFHAQYVLCNITIVLVFLLSFFLVQTYPPTWSFWPHRIFLGSRFSNIICNRIASQFILNAQQKKNAKTHGSTFHFKFLLGSALPSAQCSCLTMHIICFTPQCNAFHYQP